jgi:hypothetical protein
MAGYRVFGCRSLESSCRRAHSAEETISQGFPLMSSFVFFVSFVVKLFLGFSFFFLALSRTQSFVVKQFLGRSF